MDMKLDVKISKEINLLVWKLEVIVLTLEMWHISE